MLGFYQNRVNHAVFTGFLSSHPVVAVTVALNFFKRLSRVLGDDIIKLMLEFLDFTGRDLDVRGLALSATHGLMYHHA